MYDLGVFSSLGEAWAAALRTIYQRGVATAYTDNTGEPLAQKKSSD